jgi:hypothetical protein
MTIGRGEAKKQTKKISAMSKKLSHRHSPFILMLLFVLISISAIASGNPPKQEFYQQKIYHLKSDSQLLQTDSYLKDAYLPALHRAGIKNIGVFKPIANDTAAEKFVYVLIPFTSVDEWMNIND